MRQAVAQAMHHARHRTAFQKQLIDQPLMTNVLADLALESRSGDRADHAAGARLRRERRGVAGVPPRGDAGGEVLDLQARARCWRCEAMEVLGGSGYIEESIMPRLYREAPVNSIWEGSGNVMCLDVLRAIERTPKAADVLRARTR